MYYGQVAQALLTFVSCVIWTLPDPSNATTYAFQLNDVSAWLPLISVKCSIPNQMPICDSAVLAGHVVGKLECDGLQPQTQLRKVASCVKLADLLPVLRYSPEHPV